MIPGKLQFTYKIFVTLQNNSLHNRCNTSNVSDLHSEDTHFERAGTVDTLFDVTRGLI